MAFKPGQSGNPAGKPKGAKHKLTILREQIAEHVPAIITRLVQAARDGDVQAANLLLSRALPPARAESLTARIDNPGGTLAEQAQAISAAVLAGELPPSLGADMMNVLQAQARVIEVAELEARIAALEMTR